MVIAESLFCFHKLFRSFLFKILNDVREHLRFLALLQFGIFEDRTLKLSVYLKLWPKRAALEGTLRVSVISLVHVCINLRVLNLVKLRKIVYLAAGGAKSVSWV